MHYGSRLAQGVRVPVHGKVQWYYTLLRWNSVIRISFFFYECYSGIMWNAMEFTPSGIGNSQTCLFRSLLCYIQSMMLSIGSFWWHFWLISFYGSGKLNRHFKDHLLHHYHVSERYMVLYEAGVHEFIEVSLKPGFGAVPFSSLLVLLPNLNISRYSSCPVSTTK